MKIFSFSSDFHVIPPLDGCTYEGIDSGSQPNEVKHVQGMIESRKSLF